MAFLERLEQARNEPAKQTADPWRKTLEGVLQGVQAISSAALLDVVRAQATTGTARRLAAIMRSLGFIPIKSRRLMPGGRAGNTVTRGWARPVKLPSGSAKSDALTSKSRCAVEPFSQVKMKGEHHVV
jgi:hypothetical protein